MLPLRLAVATEFFAQPLRPALQTAAGTGAEAVRFETRTEVNPKDFTATGRRQLRHYLGELDLSVAALKFPARRSFYDEEHLEARIAAFRDVMQLAYDLGASVVTTRIGRVPTEETSPQLQTLTEVVNDLAASANRIGVTLAVSPADDDPKTLAAFLDRIDRGPIGVDFDPAAWVMTRRDPGEVFRDLYERVVHVVGRDAVRDTDGGGREVPLGRGDANWEELLALLDDAHYSGWVTVERQTGEDRIGESARAVRFLRTVAGGE